MEITEIIRNIIYGITILVGIYVLIGKVFGLRVIKSNEVGIMEKWWSKKGSLKNGLIALNGEAGYQANILRAGIHFKSALIYKIYKVPLITIPQGQIGYVFARDGQALEPTQTLGAKVIESNNFQDVKAFLENGGQKGPQSQILREGTYAFNLAQFIIITQDKTYQINLGDEAEQQSIEKMSEDLKGRDGFKPLKIDGKEDTLAVITVMDGPSLPNGEIIAPIVGDNSSNKETYHNNFQNPEAFLRAGGFRGRQLQVLSEGIYYLNQLFVSVEQVRKTVIPIGFVGVVVSYTGKKGKDTSGENYKHGELVEKGCMGVWKEPLMPGKYSFNPYSGRIKAVPTTNIILKWIQGEANKDHKYDENLKEVDIITQDAFSPSLPLSVVINIDYRNAPLVVQRFGDINKLVEQTLDPLVASYFKNIGQKKTLLELIQDRSNIQDEATGEMKAKFENYSLNLEEVLIGTPSSENDKSIDTILKQLKDRQVAKEQIQTYKSQTEAADKEMILRESQAKAEQQTDLTKSQIAIKVQENTGEAEYKKSIKEAEKIKTLAKAEAEKISILAEAQATKEASIGIAKSIAVKKQVEAYGGPQYQVLQVLGQQIAEAIKEAKIDIVPKNVVSLGSEKNGNNNILQSLLGLALSKHMGIDLKNNVENNSIRQSSSETKQDKEFNKYAEKLEKDIVKNIDKDNLKNKEIDQKSIDKDNM